MTSLVSRSAVMPTDSMINTSNSSRSCHRGSGYHTPQGDEYNNLTITTSIENSSQSDTSDSDNEYGIKSLPEYETNQGVNICLPEIEIEGHTPQVFGIKQKKKKN